MAKKKDSELYERLENLRAGTDLSQYAFAKLLGLNPQHYYALKDAKGLTNWQRIAVFLMEKVGVKKVKAWLEKEEKLSKH
jgi:DNA-binding XRE family transcriptional regulator